MIKRFIIISAILSTLFIFLVESPVYAHCILIEPVKEGLVQVIFDDGSVARHAEITVYDENDEEIINGEVDSEGLFSYPPEKAEIIVAEDDFGHRAEYNVGEELHTGLSRGPTITAVFAGFIIAALFQYRINKRYSKQKS